MEWPATGQLAVDVSGLSIYTDVADISRLVAQYSDREEYGNPEPIPTHFDSHTKTLTTGFLFHDGIHSTHYFTLTYNPVCNQWYRHEKPVTMHCVLQTALEMIPGIIQRLAATDCKNIDLFEGIERCTIEAPKYQAEERVGMR